MTHDMTADTALRPTHAGACRTCTDVEACIEADVALDAALLATGAVVEVAWDETVCVYTLGDRSVTITQAYVDDTLSGWIIEADDRSQLAATYCQIREILPRLVSHLTRDAR